MATQVRSTLADERQTRTEQVAELRQRIDTHLSDRREQLQEAFQGFQDARQSLAKDFRQAADLWRGQHAAEGGHARVHPVRQTNGKSVSRCKQEPTKRPHLANPAGKKRTASVASKPAEARTRGGNGKHPRKTASHKRTK